VVVGDYSSVVVARGCAAEVAVFESVAVSFQGDDFGMVKRRSIMAATTTSSQNTFA
jgi:hypothetical protein